MFNQPGFALAQPFPLTIGIVSDNQDPKKLYRVRVTFPLLPVEESSFWCRICTIGAGRGGMGVHFLPEVGDEVLVAFLNGDPQQAVIMGALWNGKNKPAYAEVAGLSETGRYAGNAMKRATIAGANDIRSISSRAGHELIFNDTSSKPFAMLHSGTKHRIVLNDEGGVPTKIEIYDGKEENFIEIHTVEKRIIITSITGDIEIKAKKNIRLTAEEGNVEITAQQGVAKVEAGTNLKLTAGQNASMEASGSAKVSSGSTTDIVGPKVNLN